MTPRVSFAIQTHELRAEMAAELNACLGGRAELVFDPDPSAGRNPWRTYREALERPWDGDVRLVLQDDVLVCDGFVETVEAVAAARPDRVVAFFVGGNPMLHRRAVLQAAGLHQRYVDLSLATWIPAVATLWPRRLVEPLCSFVDAQRWPPSFTADDEIIGRFLSREREVPIATVPSLVEHPDTVPSLANHRRAADGLDAGRRAALWMGDEGWPCDARLLDWS